MTEPESLQSDLANKELSNTENVDKTIELDIMEAAERKRIKLLVIAEMKKLGSEKLTKQVGGRVPKRSPKRSPRKMTSKKSPRKKSPSRRTKSRGKN